MAFVTSSVMSCHMVAQHIENIVALQVLQASVESYRMVECRIEK